MRYLLSTSIRLIYGVELEYALFENAIKVGVNTVFVSVELETLMAVHFFLYA